jgi:small subunit ribosomal protein S20
VCYGEERSVLRKNGRVNSTADDAQIPSAHPIRTFAVRKQEGYNDRQSFSGGFRLANLRSAIKRIRSNERKRERNRIVRSRARSAVGAARAAPKESKEAAIRKAIRELDLAASKGVIHKNNAARRKSRLLRELNALQPPAKKNK